MARIVLILAAVVPLLAIAMSSSDAKPEKKMYFSLSIPSPAATPTAEKPPAATPPAATPPAATDPAAPPPAATDPAATPPAATDPAATPPAATPPAATPPVATPAPAAARTSPQLNIIPLGQFLGSMLKRLFGTTGSSIGSILGNILRAIFGRGFTATATG